MFRRRQQARAIANANELASAGNYRDAIDTLTAANRRHRDESVERRLVELRSEAYAPIGDTSNPSPWPPEVEDLFPGVAAPPEIARDELTPETLRSGILCHGSLLVRGLVDPTAARGIARTIDRAFDSHDASVAGTGKATSRWFTPFDGGERYPEGANLRPWLRKSGGLLAVDSPAAMFEVTEAFEQAGIGPLVAEFLGEYPLMLGGKWTLRRVSSNLFSPDEPPEWHQDGAFMGLHVRSVNVWLALSEAGVEAPGLDFAGRRFDDIVETGTCGAKFDWSVGQEVVDRVAQSTLVRPRFNPGDALLFDHLLLHRTTTDVGMKNQRYAVEAWFAAPSGYPDDQLPIVY